MKFSIRNIIFFPGWQYALGALVVALAAGYFFFGNGSNTSATLVITPGDFKEQISISGTVIAAQNTNLGFAANGRISGTYAKVGQQVAAGTLLAQIENGDLFAALAQKQAALTEARANLQSLQTGTRPEEIAVAAASVASAQSALIDAIQSAYTTSDDSVHNKLDTMFVNPRTDPKLSFITANSILKSVVEQDRSAIEPVLLKWGTLVATLSNANVADTAARAQTYLGQVVTLLADANSAVNQGLPDTNVSAATLASYGTTIATARTSINTVAATLAADIAALNSAQTNLTLQQAGSTSEDIAAGQAAVAAAQADVENAQAALAKTRVVAPFAGIITRMDAKVGEIVSPTESLISMQSNGIFQAETFIPEVSISGVAIGNPATTTLDAYGSAAVFPAKVIAVDPAETVKNGVPTYKTTLSFLSPDARIRSGMTASVVIETGVLHNAIVIPAGAVGQKNGEPYVSVVSNNETNNRAVTTGPSPAFGQIEIRSGLSAGDIILLTPAP